MGKRVTLYAFVALFLIVSVLPLGNLFAEAFFSADTPAILIQTLHDSYIWKLFFQSLLLSASVALGSTIFGVLLGILLTKSNLPAKPLFLLLFTLPLLLPPFVEPYALLALFGQHFSSPFGMWLAQTLLYTPIMLLGSLYLLLRSDARLEEVALMHTTYLQTLRTITLPLLAPSLGLLAMLIFFLSFGNYSVSNILRQESYILYIFREFAAFYDYQSAFIHASLIPMLVLLLLFFAKTFLFKEYPITQQPLHRNFTPLPLGRYRLLVVLLLGNIAFFLIVAPFLKLLWLSASIQTYIKAFSLSYEALLHSFFYAALGAAVIALLGFFLALALKTFRCTAFVDTLALGFFSLPGIVIAMALILFFNTKSFEFIYTSSAMLLLGFLIKYTALGLRSASSALEQFDTAYEDAATLLGASWFARLRYIILPMHTKSLLVAFFLLFSFLFRESDIAMMLSPLSQESFSVKLLTLMANTPESLAAALCILSLASTLVVALPIFTMIRKHI